ncbi:MAG: HAD-IB family hydrolase [Chitinivibrionales bacterium]|nr:HAD-IB family hydrolase [Chitinivibrionales bacterium]
MVELKKAAIFDLDGTLIRNASAEVIFFRHLLFHGGLSPFNLIQMLAALWTARGNFHAMTRENKRYLRNKNTDKLETVAREYFEPRTDNLVFPVMHRVIEEHREKGDVLLLLSGTLDLIAACFQRHLKFDGARAAKLEHRDGKYTGRLEGIIPYGFGKLEALRELMRHHNVDANKTTLYANIFSDRYVMNAVERAVAVNPDRRLRAYAARRGWQVIDPVKR